MLWHFVLEYSTNWQQSILLRHEILKGLPLLQFYYKFLQIPLEENENLKNYLKIA